MADAAAGSVDVRPIHVKLVLLGDAAVGKSSVVLRFASGTFEPNKEPTIGAAFLTRQCPLEGCALRYDIWDTAGQERFHSLAPMYYRNAQAAVVVYDVTKAATLEKAKSWVKELQLQANPLVIALVGNKVDLVQSSHLSSDSTPPPEGELEGESDGAIPTTVPTPREPDSLRQVPSDEAQAYAKEARLLFFETSAKTGVGISEMFTEIAKKIPIERILASTSNGSGRSGAASRSGGAPGRVGAAGQEVNLGEQQSKKDACNC